MDRITQLSGELSAVLEELQLEAATRNLCQLMAPLAWLDEANGWLRFELGRLEAPAKYRDPVPFTYVPVDLRR